jgi:hypothetical protein
MVVNDQVDKRGDVDGRNRSSLYQEVASISRESFEIYAEEIGCEYMFSDERVFTEGHGCALSTLFECLRVVYDPYFDQFDKVLFADADIVVNTKENIFDVSDAEVYGVLESDIRVSKGGYNAWDYDEKILSDYLEKFEMHDCPIVPSLGVGKKFDSKLTIMNTGVVVWTKEARLKARKVFDDWQPWCYPKMLGKDTKVHTMSITNDQPFISSQLTKHNFDIESIDQSWNDTPIHYRGELTHETAISTGHSKFLHYTGGSQKTTMVDFFYDDKFPIFQEGW